MAGHSISVARHGAAWHGMAWRSTSMAWHDLDVASLAAPLNSLPPTLLPNINPSPSQPCPPQFYNGNAKLEPGAVVCRVAKSFIRFGTFQLPATRWVLKQERLWCMVWLVPRAPFNFNFGTFQLPATR